MDKPPSARISSAVRQKKDCQIATFIFSGHQYKQYLINHSVTLALQIAFEVNPESFESNFRGSLQIWHSLFWGLLLQRILFLILRASFYSPCLHTLYRCR